MSLVYFDYSIIFLTFICVLAKSSSLTSVLTGFGSMVALALSFSIDLAMSAATLIGLGITLTFLAMSAATLIDYGVILASGKCSCWWGDISSRTSAGIPFGPVEVGI